MTAYVPARVFFVEVRGEPIPDGIDPDAMIKVEQHDEFADVPLWGGAPVWSVEDPP